MLQMMGSSYQLAQDRLKVLQSPSGDTKVALKKN
jgi:hypothetical protein